MKAFKFPLQAVQIIRTHKDFLAQEQLGYAIKAQLELENRLERTREVSAEQAKRMLQTRDGSYKAMTVTSALKAYQTSRAEEAMIERLIDLAKIEVAKKRGILVETNRELKVVTQLKEKAFTSYTIESHREQQNALDEIAGYRAFSI